MLIMESCDRQELTSGLLRVVTASLHLCRVVLGDEQYPASSWAGRMSNPLSAEPGGDRNYPLQTVRLVLRTSTESALQHGLALFELSRSKRALAVPLATVTRGAIEAFGRAHWLLTSDTMEELVSRTASLEYVDMEYPAKFGMKLRRLPVESIASTPVAQYREDLIRWLESRGLPLVPLGTSGLAVRVLDASYGDGRLVYSDISAAAHGRGWATANFYDFSTSVLQRDDELLISYCKYVMETTRVVTSYLAARFESAAGERDRWGQTLEQVDATLAEFVSPKSDHLSD